MFLRTRTRLAVAALACGISCGSGAALQAQSPAPVAPAAQQPVAQQPVAQQPAAVQTVPMNAAPAQQPVRVAQQAVAPWQAKPETPGEHPLMPTLRWARDKVENIRTLDDYSATLYKRERVNGQLGEYQAMFVKVRHRPFSVYLYFLSPSNVHGQEVIYVDGLNGGQMQAHATGIKNIVGTVSLNPIGTIAMRGNRYPITEIGLLNLTERLIEIGEKDSQYGECEVQFYENAKINGRLCTCIQVVHPVPRKNFLFNVGRIFVDNEFNVPVRYEAYDWPTEPGGTPQLTEEYTYQNLKFNNGFTDLDFDTRNPKYNFR